MKPLVCFWLCLTASFSVFGEFHHSVLKIGSRSRLINEPLDSSAASPAIEESVASARQVHSLYPGPWGDLEYYTFYLQNPHPDEKFPNATYWNFVNLTIEEVLKKLEKTGISKIDLQQCEIFKTGKEVRVVPTNRLILSLTPEIRARLRALLQQWPGKNPCYAYPTIVVSGNPVQWYTDAGLTPATVSLIHSLCYKLNGSVVFSEIPTVWNSIKNPEEKKLFLKTMTRTRTLILRLNITEESDTKTIRDYWTLRNQRKALLPLFDSIAETHGVDKLDIIHLLPPQARKQLYTFSNESSMDCHSTCLAFSGVTPDSREIRSEQWTDVFNTYYYPAKNPLEFGDIIVIFNQETKKVIHSAVYIAGDIVFTKNGFFRPCTFMLWNDMLSNYQLDSGTYTKVYRRQLTE